MNEEYGFSNCENPEEIHRLYVELLRQASPRGFRERHATWWRVKGVGLRRLTLCLCGRHKKTVPAQAEGQRFRICVTCMRRLPAAR